MQISSIGAPLSPPAAATAQPPEASEAGADHDNDGDEGGVSSAPALPAPPPGRGGNVDMLT
jgi:hypothetical protein